MILPQQLGFGCLGLVGGFAGYDIQNYKASGLNNLVSSFNSVYKDSISQSFNDFIAAKGFRFGINFFRKDLKGVIITIKGFYQILNDKKEAQLLQNNIYSNYNYDLKLNQFGIGFDFGTNITRLITWKIIDASFYFTSTKFIITENVPSIQSIKREFSNDKTSFGVTIGSGIIFNIIENYISIEGTAGYSFFKIDKMKSYDGNYLNNGINSNTPINDFIENGHLNMLVQLNIGFPI